VIWYMVDVHGWYMVLVHGMYMVHGMVHGYGTWLVHDVHGYGTWLMYMVW
jgi:hypothetical protein